MYALPLYNNFNTVSSFQTGDKFLQVLLKKKIKKETSIWPVSQFILYSYFLVLSVLITYDKSFIGLFQAH